MVGLLLVRLSPAAAAAARQPCKKPPTNSGNNQQQQQLPQTTNAKHRIIIIIFFPFIFTDFSPATSAQKWQTEEIDNRTKVAVAVLARYAFFKRTIYIYMPSISISCDMVNVEWPNNRNFQTISIWSLRILPLLSSIHTSAAVIL